MNNAIKELRESKPEVYREFLRALSQDLGLPSPDALAEFRCPNCNTAIHIVVSADAAGRSGPGGRQRKAGESLNDLLIELARRRRVTTGVINAEFKKLMGKKIRGMKKEDARNEKISWLKKELSKTKPNAA